MKLLLDQNLSRHLVPALAKVFPGTLHVSALGLERAADEIVWEQAAQDGLTIVTKDADFYQRSVLRGFPPKVVWLTLGNCSKRDVLEALLDAYPELEAFANDPEQALMILGRKRGSD